MATLYSIYYILIKMETTLLLNHSAINQGPNLLSSLSLSLPMRLCVRQIAYSLVHCFCVGPSKVVHYIGNKVSSFLTFKRMHVARFALWRF